MQECREENDCKEPDDACSKSCRAQCCESDNQDIVVPPRDEQRMCDKEEERNCFSECKKGDGPHGDGNCADDDLSISEQAMCIQNCRENCCKWESESKEGTPTPPPTPQLTESKSEPAPLPTPPPPTPAPVVPPTPAPVMPPTPAPTPRGTEAREESTYPPTAAKCNTKMDVSDVILLKAFCLSSTPFM